MSGIKLKPIMSLAGIKERAVVSVLDAFRVILNVRFFGMGGRDEKVVLHGDMDDKYCPPGSVVIWTGAQDTVPGGWALCNGDNGTPDLSAESLTYIMRLEG